MRAKFILFLTLAVACLLGACSDGASPTPAGPGAVRMLPDAFYGEWERIGVSGGLDGRGVPVEAEGHRDTVRLTHENELHRQRTDGTVVSKPFEVRRGKTIFSSEDQWLIVLDTGMLQLVLQLGEGDTLLMSENVYDGFNSSYRRVK